MNPSSENIAVYVYRKLNDEFQDENIRVSKVRVSEAPNVGVYYWED
jgi:6-pyruvoyltetrahydropterin/6-carboxytetrahydropterin synthase